MAHLGWVRVPAVRRAEQRTQAAPRLGVRAVQAPTGHWVGERAATDILVLARKGRAFAAFDSLIARQGGKRDLYGAALALGRDRDLGGAGRHDGPRAHRHLPGLTAGYRIRRQTVGGTRAGSVRAR